MTSPQIEAESSKALGATAKDAINIGRLVTHYGGQSQISEKMQYGAGLHLLVFGPNGSGKTTRLLQPNLLQLEDRSIVVVDPKGELAAVSAPFRRKVGEVVIINPFNILADREGYGDLKSQGFNPLLAIDPDAESFNSDAALLAEALIKVESKDPHWDGSAQAMLAAIIMYVCIEAKRTDHPPTLRDVRTLLCMASEIGNKENNFEASGVPAVAEEMMRSSIAGLRNKAGQFRHWSEEVRSIASTARRQTEPFDDNEVADDLDRGTFDFREMKKRPITVYLILPPEMMERHAKWLRLVLTAAFRGVLRPRELGEPMTLFMIDEFAALGHLPVIETVWSMVRGYGIQIMPVLQDLHQLKSIYKERWETFIGNAGVVVSLGAREMTSAKWMSERAGDKTVVAASASASTGSGPSGDSANASQNWSQVKVPFLSPQKFLALRDGYLVVWLAGVAETIVAYAPAYWRIIRLAGRARKNPYHQEREPDAGAVARPGAAEVTPEHS